MGVNWSHLPPEVIAKICMCMDRGKKDGYGLDKESGYWVHSVHTDNRPPCNKPSPLTAVIECDICEKAFVPDKYKTVQMSFLGAMCQECEGS